jgi:hypothetical protein
MECDTNIKPTGRRRSTAILAVGLGVSCLLRNNTSTRRDARLPHRQDACAPTRPRASFPKKPLRPESSQFAMLRCASLSESAPIIVNREPGQHDAQRDRAIGRRSEDGASDNSGTGQDKQDRGERVSRHAIDGRVRSDVTTPQNEERCRRHSEKNEINGYCKVQNLAIRP